ncbi:response regulator transcription factor [Hymenobacter sp. NBH84]|uniref:LytR/AlgR family response regulator transcription factor n=1 Tax=Hymenobacter sp. NBH84 TaxID=2596915 RepID=UPI00162AB6E5|nr:LytTR family DNA-binding domain-containing protein [Hymenobacter sp. NBH84]QNE38249.1 response regulator transcription factor [Hymenobacter sp. NBH84]
MSIAPTRCLIVDDEPLAHQVLTRFIAQTPGLVLSGQCRNAVEAHDYLRQHPVDLLFLDIEMPLVTGLHFLKALENPPKTILTTAYREYAYEGYELEVLDYLLKPFSYERFAKAVARYQPPAPVLPDAATQEYLLLKDQGGLLKVPLSTIRYVEGCKDYVKVVTETKTYLHHATMQKMTELLGPRFVRAHRSFIVGAAHIKLLQPEQLVLTDGNAIPIGNSYKLELRAYFEK